MAKNLLSFKRKEGKRTAQGFLLKAMAAELYGKGSSSRDTFPGIHKDFLGVGCKTNGLFKRNQLLDLQLLYVLFSKIAW